MSGDVVRYGDGIVLESCESSEHLFLGIVRRCEGRRNPLLLSTEVSEAHKHAPSDYQWRVLPVVGSKRKWGDPVSFADRVRLQLVDDKGNSRMLSVSHLDNRSIMAERRPTRMDACTWWLTYTSELKVGRDGRMMPAGEIATHLQYGADNYVGLINGARYLAAMDDPYRVLRQRTLLLDDLPSQGTGPWWRIHRSLWDVVPNERRMPREAQARETMSRSMSLA